MSEHLTRKVYVNGKEETVKLKPRATASTRLSREEKAKAREEARIRESIEVPTDGKPAKT